jgi:arsenical pump membrane protein
VAARPSDAAHAAAQDWSPFVLVAGLLLIGLVADGDGLFEAAGYRLARAARGSGTLYAGSVLLVSAVTATLNLDTSVAFLTPVLVHTARNRGDGEPALLYGCLLLSNAASLLLPGSNLTNLIVLGHLHLTGGQFAARMWLPWLGAITVTALVVAFGERQSLRMPGSSAAGVSAAGSSAAGLSASPRTAQASGAALGRPPRLVPGVGLVAIVAATLLVLLTRSAALPVLLTGALAAGIRLAQRRQDIGKVWQTLGVPLLAGLFGAAVALGTLGRAWSGPADFLAQLPGWATAAFAAAATALVNNLPAASMLAARTPSHPFQLLAGLNLGPNLCVTGSLAWLLWLQSARNAGAAPSLRRASKLGLIAVPLSLAVAVAALALTA